MYKLACAGVVLTFLPISLAEIRRKLERNPELALIGLEPSVCGIYQTNGWLTGLYEPIGVSKRKRVDLPYIDGVCNGWLDKYLPYLWWFMWRVFGNVICHISGGVCDGIQYK